MILTIALKTLLKISGTFYGNAFDLAYAEPSTYDLSDYFEPRELYGRTNTLRFKLCNLHCRTCLKFGVTEIKQECENNRGITVVRQVRNYRYVVAVCDN